MEDTEERASMEETEEMEGLDYDSDVTNMSMSLSSDPGGDAEHDIDGSSHEEDSDEIEIEPGSPVLGERILQGGMILSQRASERVRTPVPDGGRSSRERARTPAFIDETDSEAEYEDITYLHHPPPLRIPSVFPPEAVREGTSSSSSSFSLQPLPETSDSSSRQSIDPDESSSDTRLSTLRGQSTSYGRLSPLPGQSTSDDRLPLLPEQSTSANRSSPLPEQSASDTRLAPLVDQDSSDSRSSPQPGQSTSRSSIPPLTEQSASVVSGHSSVPDQSTHNNQAQSDSTENTSLGEAKPLAEVTPKKVKAPTEAPPSPESDDEGQICSICFEPWANSGAHRLASLKCGHIFGNSCIERWLKGQGGKCPQCNAKATKRDIRVLYAKSLKVLDTSERDRVVRELEKEKEARRKLEMEHAQTKLQYELKSFLVVKLQSELKGLRNAVVGSSNTMSQGMGLSQGTSSDTKNKLVIHSGLDIVKDGGCRVMAYNEWLNMIVVSMPSQVTMFPGAGVKKINMLDVKPERYIPIHQKQIRDIAFNPAKNDLLLSVGMDKLVKLTNVCNNAPVASFTAEAPLWSCCWNADQANQFFVGTATGSVIVYDTRITAGPIQTFKVTGSGPVVSMCYIPYNASANFCTGGLLVARLSSCSFVVVKENDIQDNALLLEGPFTSVSFERSTRHFMVSCRPSQKYPHARHLVCVLQNVNISNNATDRSQVITVNTIQTFRGGTTQKVLSRSCLVAHPLQTGCILACASDESTQSTCIWDVSTGARLQQLKCKETVIDLIQVKSSQSAYLALLTDKSVKFYKWVDVL